MPKLSISLLGTPSITLDDKPLDAQTYKATALLAYLAINRQPHSRIELATLLWTELDKEKALAALRTTLWKLKQVGIDHWLVIQRDTIELTMDEHIVIDTAQFQELISQCETHGHHPSKTCGACLPPLTAAVSLYRGDFMKGFSLRDAGEFDNWQSLNHEIFRQDLRQSLSKLVQGYRALGEIDQAIRFARRWITHDRYNEDIHRQLMNMYASSGQRTEALIHYRDYARMLRRESSEPQYETTQLYHQVMDQKVDRLLGSHELEKPILMAVDIENASAMWANYREQMVRTVNRFLSIVKDCANQFGGQVFNQTGDSMVLIFDSGYPLHCALAIHKRLLRASWTIGSLPRVRTAFYAAHFRHPNVSDYTTDAFRAQRILSAGWGGQVLLTTHVLNSVDLPQQARAFDLGIHLLKDLGEPLRIYRLTHPDLPAGDFPPLQSLSNYRHNLPDYPTTFIGREKEQADLSALLANEKCRLLTLVGPGGVGKTRLALQVAAQNADNFADGIYFIPVAVPKTPELIPAILTETFKFHFFEQKEPIDLIIDYLREKNILLIFDNFEHLVEGSVFLLKLLHHAPGLKIIVTSRERLNLHEEWLYEVSGMLVPPMGITTSADHYSAVQLFIQNARRMLPGFDPTPQDLEAIIQICHIVDGLPLAIELATAWVRTLSCQEIAREIGLNLDFLSSSMRDVPDRHRSLRAVFEHSWSLLSEEGRRTFRRLAVFRGGFTADAALHVTRTSPILLASFVDRSLLRHLPMDRYEMIEVLRHFALYKLEENQEDALNTRNLHSTYYAELLARNFPILIGPDQNNAINEIRSDLENIRIAWNHAVNTENWPIIDKSLYGLMAYKEVLGHTREELELFQAALDRLQTCSTPGLQRLQGNLQSRAGWMTFSLGDHAAGVQSLQTAQDILSVSGSELEAATTLYLLAKANERLNHSQLAIEQAETCLHIFQDERYRNQRRVQSLISNVYAVYGLALIKVNRVREAKKVLQDSLRIHQQIGTRFGSIHVLEALGRVQDAEGDIAGAQLMRLQALALAREIGNKHSIAILLNNISHNYIRLHEYEPAIKFQQDSIDLAREIGNRWLTAIGINNLAYSLLAYHNDSLGSIHLYQESLAIFSDLEDHRGVIYTLFDLAMATLKAGLVESSLSSLREALKKSTQFPTTELSLYVLSGMAAVYAQARQPDLAYEVCQRVFSDPSANEVTRRRVIELTERLSPALTETHMQAAILRGRERAVDYYAADLLAPG